MNYNYEKIQSIIDGAGLLYNMIGELTEGIDRLPGCTMTARLKDASKNVGRVSYAVYRTMKEIAAESEEPCDMCEEYEDDEDEYGEADIPTGGDLEELLNVIADILSSGKPVSISADIYINEGNGENTDNDAESEE
ncbi:MAG: hypothetical protein Q4G33_11095 [bacterium]|nr:hypothetical protein [bacterium]